MNKVNDMVLRVPAAVAPDKGKHYRFQIEVPITEEDLQRGYAIANLDPFRIAEIYGISNFAQNTALKKVLCAGNRGKKNLIEDIDDIVTAMLRWKQMIVENELLEKAKQSPINSDQQQENKLSNCNSGWACYD